MLSPRKNPASVRSTSVPVPFASFTVVSGPAFPVAFDDEPSVKSSDPIPLKSGSAFACGLLSLG